MREPLVRLLRSPQALPVAGVRFVSVRRLRSRAWLQPVVRSETVEPRPARHRWVFGVPGGVASSAALLVSDDLL